MKVWVTMLAELSVEGVVLATLQDRIGPLPKRVWSGKPSALRSSARTVKAVQLKRRAPFTTELTFRIPRRVLGGGSLFNVEQ